ncbi:MAG TPA: SRPBCC family protein [Candidatus Angelobacter sp.]|nr:SRPBCC family protein [Candidatus Angelobacter sp.]
MTERSAVHGTFVIERTYPALPRGVFKAWADPAAKARWFAGPPDKWTEQHREFDFRVGGRERLSGVWPGGKVSAFDGLYHDIVADERIVYSYAMQLDEVRISVSLATVEFKPAGAGTRLIFTEQAAFLDGYDDSGSREQGTGTLLDKLGAELQRAASA